MERNLLCIVLLDQNPNSERARAATGSYVYVCTFHARLPVFKSGSGSGSGSGRRPLVLYVWNCSG